MSKPETKMVKVGQLLDGSSWSFLCFTADQWKLLIDMLMDLKTKACRPLSFRHVHFPEGVLWNGRECHALLVPKELLSWTDLERGLRAYLGYEALEPEFDVFTLGLTPAEDAAFDRVGLFGRNK